MNERIRELAEQMDWEEMGADLYGKSMDGCMTIHALEKFAELIIQECCSAIRLDDVFNGGKFQRTILEHFGVEL